MCNYDGLDGEGPVGTEKTRPRQWINLQSANLQTWQLPGLHSKVLYNHAYGLLVALALQMCRSLCELCPSILSA